MLQLIDKKKKIYFYIFIFFLVSTLNNISFLKVSNNFLNVKKIDVKGLNKNLNSEIHESVRFLLNNNLLFVDKEKLTKKLNEFSFLDSYEIFKKFPSNIEIILHQTELVGTTIKENKKFFIGNNGKLIPIETYENYKELPNVFGDFVVDDYLNLIKKFKLNEFKYNNITDYYFFPSGRWDIKTSSGNLIKFSSSNLNKSIKIAKKIIESSSIKKKKILDLRIPNQVIILNE